MHRIIASVVVLMIALGGWETVTAQEATHPSSPVASPAADLTGVAPLPLTGERLAAFEAYVAEILAAAEVPGAAVAVVQGGQVTYAQGFGVKELGTDAPVTPDTLMQVGSTQKSMTSLLAASLVDAGRLRWDTRLVDLLPGFATGDPALTERLTVADAFCACSGLPRRDLELVFNSAPSAWTARPSPSTRCGPATTTRRRTHGT